MTNLQVFVSLRVFGKGFCWKSDENPVTLYQLSVLSIHTLMWSNNYKGFWGMTAAQKLILTLLLYDHWCFVMVSTCLQIFGPAVTRILYTLVTFNVTVVTFYFSSSVAALNQSTITVRFHIRILRQRGWIPSHRGNFSLSLSVKISSHFVCSTESTIRHDSPVACLSRLALGVSHLMCF